MDNKLLFMTAHHKTRLQQLKAIALKRDFNYQVTFTYYLKELKNEQLKLTVYDGLKVTTTYHKKPKVNEACAMVGDYAKPEYKLDGLKIHHFKNECLTVTYNLDTLLHFIISAIAVIIIFALSLQAINLI